jgi:hypothetical protein
MPYLDKEKRNECQRRHYERNKEAIKKKVSAQRKVSKAKWAAFKKTLSCLECGENHPATLDFHHVNPHESDNKVHKLLASGAYLKAREEIKKCIVLCANCHRKHHYEEFQHKKRVAKKKKPRLVSGVSNSKV